MAMVEVNRLQVPVMLSTIANEDTANVTSPVTATLNMCL